MSDHFGNFIFEFQCGFRQRLSAQRSLLVITERWKKCGDKGKAFRALPKDFLKAFDYNPHDLIIAKSNAYDLSLSASKLLHNWLSCRIRRRKINIGSTIIQHFCFLFIFDTE